MLTFCGCAHSVALHHPAGRCTVSLPPYEEEELPSWSCPCRGYRPAPAPAGGAWRWHPESQTWTATPAGLPSPRPASEPAPVTAPTGSPAATPAATPAAAR